MRGTSSNALAMSILGFGLIGLGLLVFSQSDSGLVTTEAGLADQLSDDSVSAVKALADYGPNRSERNAGEVPQRVRLPEGLRTALLSAIEQDSYEITRSAEQPCFLTRQTSGEAFHSHIWSRGYRAVPGHRARLAELLCSFARRHRR